MQRVNIVFGTFNDCDEQDLLGIYTTAAAAEARAKSAEEAKTFDDHLAPPRYAYAYVVYNVELDTDIDL